MTISTQQTRELHDYYNSLVAKEGLGVPYTMTLHFRYESWLAAGFTKTDMAMVVGYIRRRIAKGKREKESLLLRNLLQSHDEFSENLSMARSESRAPRTDTDRASVLRATGRPVTEEKPAESVGKVMTERPKLAQMLKEWREKNL